MDDISVRARRILIAVGLLLGMALGMSAPDIREYLFYRDLYQKVNDPDAPSVFIKGEEVKDLEDRFSSIVIT